MPDYTEAALLLGDVVHNLRASMDHAIWAITPNDVQETSPTDVSFPLYFREDKYDRWAPPNGELGTVQQFSRFYIAVSRSMRLARGSYIRYTSCSSCRTPTNTVY
jgi:hypothetical protein